MITIDVPRSTPRKLYRELYRMARIAYRDTREAAQQATDDMMIYGTGAVLIEPFNGARGQAVKATSINPLRAQQER